MDRYLVLLIALFLAFVVGSAFLAWVRLIQIVLWKLYIWIFRWWPKLLEQVVMRASRTQAKAVQGLEPGQRLPPPSRYYRLVMWAHARQAELNKEQDHAHAAWGRVALVLLKRYGIDGPGEDWTPWIGTVGALRTQDFRGAFMVMSLHALGWSGLAAIYVAPELRTLP